MPHHDYRELAAELESLLRLGSPPLAISFSGEPPSGVPLYEGRAPEPTADGRTGTVPAGCVFWMKATQGTFTTVPEDHANCSVGSLTHGLIDLRGAAAGGDVAALVEAGWVSEAIFPEIPVVRSRPGYITYGPLRESPVAPDVVFLRLNAKQAMLLRDALPELRFEGKPQCHIIPIAKEHGQVAVSVGCMLSRVRTGMSNNEMTCAIPGGRLAELIAQLRDSGRADAEVAAYASEDAGRFR